MSHMDHAFIAHGGYVSAPAARTTDPVMTVTCLPEDPYDGGSTRGRASNALPPQGDRSRTRLVSQRLDDLRLPVHQRSHARHGRVGRAGHVPQGPAADLH